jgi:hypothetical protein
MPKERRLILDTMTPSETLFWLQGCWNRCLKLENKDKVLDKNHELYIVWSNVKLMLYTSVESEYKPLADEYITDMTTLALFARRLDLFSKTNMLVNDDTVHKIMYEWRELLFFDPSHITIKDGIIL